jgi:hypothetical protein
VRKADKLTTFIHRLSLNLGDSNSWNPQGLSRSLMGLLYHFNYLLLTTWSRVLLEKQSGYQPVKKFPTFYGSRSSLPHPQVPATCSYPEPDPVHTPKSHFLKNRPNIILPFTPDPANTTKPKPLAYA